MATPEVVPVLLLLLTKQDEDAADDDYNVSRAAYQCLQLYSQAVGSQLIPQVLQFVEQNLRHDDWHNRDAAVSAFGAIMEGPDEKMLNPLVKQALPVLIGMMNDKVVQVQDSAAYALGRICESVPEAIDPDTHLPSLISSLFTGLSSNPKMASSCCWALMNLADRFAGEPGCQENPLSKHFQESVSHLLQVTERQAPLMLEPLWGQFMLTSPGCRNDADGQLRTAAYEVLNSFVTNSANDSLPMVAKLSDVILQRLENTVPMQSQIVSVEDRITLEEIQTSLASVLLVSYRFEPWIKPGVNTFLPRPSFSAWSARSSRKRIERCMHFCRYSTRLAPSRAFPRLFLRPLAPSRTRSKPTLRATWTRLRHFYTMHSATRTTQDFARLPSVS